MTPPVKVAITSLLVIALVALGSADYYLAGSEYAAQLTGGNPSSGVEKMEEPVVTERIDAQGLSSQEFDDETFLAQIAGDKHVSSLVLTKDDDRIGSVSWVDGDAKGMFIQLKEALLPAFSPRVEHLSDRTLQDPLRNILTFRDDALSEETLTFVRIRERLYEFHAVEGHEETVQGLIEAVTKNE